jgi:hypothetical protein
MKVRGGVVVVEWAMAIHPPGLQRRASRLPRVTTGDTGDSEADDEGWIWLVHYLADPTAPLDTPLASVALSPSLLRQHTNALQEQSVNVHEGPSIRVPSLGVGSSGAQVPNRAPPPAPPSLSVPRVGAVGPVAGVPPSGRSNGDAAHYTGRQDAVIHGTGTGMCGCSWITYQAT